MIAAIRATNRERSIKLRALAVILLVIAGVGSAHPAAAGYDWCSKDPIFVFTHDHSNTSYTLDVQIQVPILALPLSGSARIDVLTPTNVDTSMVDVGMPGFSVDTRIANVKPKASASHYPIDFVLFVPASTNVFPVRLVVTDPHEATTLTVEGLAGQRLAVSVPVGHK